MTIENKKDLIEIIKTGQTIRPAVIFDLVYHNILTWEEFENIFLLYYKGEYSEHIRKTYSEFWRVMENRIKKSKEDNDEQYD